VAVQVTGMLLDGTMATHPRSACLHHASHVTDMRTASITPLVHGMTRHVTPCLTSPARDLQVTKQETAHYYAVTCIILIIRQNNQLIKTNKLIMLVTFLDRPSLHDLESHRSLY